MSNPEQFEHRLRQLASELRYPPTPDLLADRRGPRPMRAGARPLARAALLLAAVLLAILLAAPEARAAALRLIQLGVVRVLIAPPTAVPPAPTALATPTPAGPPAVLEGLRGATTLADATARATFPLTLPSYPADLGPPDYVFLQNLDGDAVIMVWLDPTDPARARLSLHALSSAVFVQKMLGSAESERLAETTVAGARALWVRGPHLLEVAGAGRDDLALRRIVAGNTLIWERAGVTYRLESELALDEAVRVAESLR